MQGLGVSARVLMIGAHPDDEDTYLITWLSRGRQVSTAYLSLTRGDGGQNVIGNELGEALGVLRTEELLAARRIDGALQYFTRAYDFGFSRDTVDTYRHWPKDSILGDVVRVVRAFRPHVIVAVFSGTTRDGHGQHQVSGLLAREAYDVSSDTLRFPTERFGPAWTTAKFYRAARGNAQAGTLGVDVGEYSALRGESYGEMAGRSLSQHKSQAFGALQRKGPIMNYVRREASRVNEGTPATSERSMFDGMDTTWARFRRNDSRRAAMDSLPAAFDAMRAAFNPFAPVRVLGQLARLHELLRFICQPWYGAQCARGPSDGSITAGTALPVQDADLHASVREALLRVEAAQRLASGVSIEATSDAEEWPVGVARPVIVSIYNRGADSVFASEGVVTGVRDVALVFAGQAARAIPPGGVLRDTLVGRVNLPTTPWWLAGIGSTVAPRRQEAMFTSVPSGLPENRREDAPTTLYAIAVSRRTNAPIRFAERVVRRFAHDVKGEVRRPVAAVPAISLGLGQQVQFAPTGVPIERTITATLANAGDTSVRVMLASSGGLAVDSGARIVTLGAGERGRAVSFPLRGQLRPGTTTIAASAFSAGGVYSSDYQLVDYDHINPQRIPRSATIQLTAVDVRVPPSLKVAYIAGVSDNVAPMLSQLGVPVTMLSPADVARTDLSAFTTMVIGPRAYDAHPQLVAANARLLDFARRGGTLVVQYGQYEMTQPGIMPYPITINRPHDRVTLEDAPVTILDSTARELRYPNRITDADFAGWVQERSLYMPRTFAAEYRPLLSINDPGQDPNRGAILVAPLGRGTYIYTSLALFRQLPAGVSGAARLMVNLLSAGLPATAR